MKTKEFERWDDISHLRQGEENRQLENTFSATLEVHRSATNFFWLLLHINHLKRNENSHIVQGKFWVFNLGLCSCISSIVLSSGMKRLLLKGTFLSELPTTKITCFIFTKISNEEKKILGKQSTAMGMENVSFKMYIFEAISSSHSGGKIVSRLIWWNQCVLERVQLLIWCVVNCIHLWHNLNVQTMKNQLESLRYVFSLVWRRCFDWRSATFRCFSWSVGVSLFAVE